jgi:hypothetical protein
MEHPLPVGIEDGSSAKIINLERLNVEVSSRIPLP